MTAYLIRMFGVSLALTVVIECAIAFLFRVRGRKEVLLVVLVNLLTNPPAVLCNWLFGLYLPDWPKIPVQLGIETVVILTEALIYRSFAKDDGWAVGRPVLLSVTANGCSWLLGLILQVRQW